MTLSLSLLVAKWRSSQGACCDEFHCGRDECADELEAALTDSSLREMARDAERYRWLRNAPTIPLTFGAEFDKGVDDYMAEESDAAIAAEKGAK